MVDFNISGDKATNNRDIDLVLQQIDILFDSSPGDVFGDVNFGTEYDKCLYELKVSASDIKYMVQQDLNSIDLLGFSYAVDVHLLQGTERDIILIDISLQRNGSHFNKTYSII